MLFFLLVLGVAESYIAHYRGLPRLAAFRIVSHDLVFLAGLLRFMRTAAGHRGF